MVVGPATERALLRALAKTPAARYQSGAALHAALREAFRQDGLLSERGSDRADPPRITATFVQPESTNLLEDRVLRSTGARLEQFAATLDQRGQAALRALLERSRTSEAHAVAAVTGLTSQFFGSASALLTLEESGAAAALAGGPRTASEVAEVCRIPAAPIARTMETLVALGVLGRDGDRFELPPWLATIYAGYARVGANARPLAEAAAYWSHLPHWASTGEPAMEMDTADGNVYAGVTGGLAARFAGAARTLADLLGDGGYLPPGASVLDVGAGSGVWSLAIAARDPRATVTALDRERVLETTRVYADAAGVSDRLQTVCGDWRDAPLPASAFDLALLANVCHLEPPHEVARLLRRVAGALRPGALVVIVDSIPERLAGAAAGHLLQSLHLSLRTPAGGVHDREGYTAWLTDAGFAIEHTVPAIAPSAPLTALIARLRTHTLPDPHSPG